MAETTSLGAAIAAGIAKGVEVWDIESIQTTPNDTFTPSINENVRDVKYSRWKKAVERSLGWTGPLPPRSKSKLPRLNQYDEPVSDDVIRKAVPAGLFVILSAVIITAAQMYRKM